MFTHVFGNSAQSDTREEIDREPRVLWVINREDVGQERLKLILLEPLLEFDQTHSFDNLLKHDLDEDTTRTRRVVFVHLDRFHHGPRNGVRHQQVSEEPRNVAKFVRVFSVDRRVEFVEELFERDLPHLVQLAESFSH